MTHHHIRQHCVVLRDERELLLPVEKALRPQREESLKEASDEANRLTVAPLFSKNNHHLHIIKLVDNPVISFNEKKNSPLLASFMISSLCERNCSSTEFACVS